MFGLEREKRAVEQQKGDGCERAEDFGAQVQRFPEDVRDAERFEPERFDVVREGRAARQMVLAIA
jgi:hypothetical protein